MDVKLLERLNQRSGNLTLDGGLASELDRVGCDLNHPLWSARVLVEEPESIQSVTRSFAEAGADLLATATYQATFPGLEKVGMNRKEAIDLFRRAVALAREVADDTENAPLVAASVGPFGAYLADGSEYRGDYGLTEAELAEFHRDRLEVLVDTGADLIAFETMPSGIEVHAVAELLERAHPDTEAWISCSCRDGRHLWDGTPIADLARFLRDRRQITAFGINCVDPDHAAELIARIKEAAPEMAVIVYPNAGGGWDAEAGDWRGTDTPEAFAERAKAWRAAGAAIVGGCCQATPDHIRALAETTNVG